MKVIEVPEILFQEFSETFGQGKKREILYGGLSELLSSNTRIDIVELNPEVSGFDGAIGFLKKSYPRNTVRRFILWPKIPRDKSRISNPILEPNPTFVIRGSLKDSGIHFGKRLIEESCSVKFGLQHGFELSRSDSRIAILILQRCWDLIAAADVPKQIWQTPLLSSR